MLSSRAQIAAGTAGAGQGRVLVVEADEWVTVVIRRFLSDASYEADVAETARKGFDRAVGTMPDLVLADIVLPDIDGFWLTRRIRAEKSGLASTPIILLSQKEDLQARLEGLNLGADVFLSAPFRHEEVIAQVDALIGMARRLRDSHEALPQLASAGNALQGDIAQISFPTLLTMLEMERRTGMVTVRGDGKSSASIELEEGAVVGTLLARAPCEPLAVFREVVTWTRAKYSFQPGEAKLPHPQKKPTSVLLLEAMRLNDESCR
jgi:DNA-binding response OmpR family regulator